MASVSVAEAKAHFSELLERAAGGEAVLITRRGRPLAQLTAVEKPKKRIDIAALRALTDTMQPQAESAADFIRRMRDDERY